MSPALAGGLFTTTATWCISIEVAQGPSGLCLREVKDVPEGGGDQGAE